MQKQTITRKNLQQIRIELIWEKSNSRSTTQTNSEVQQGHQAIEIIIKSAAELNVESMKVQSSACNPGSKRKLSLESEKRPQGMLKLQLN